MDDDYIRHRVDQIMRQKIAMGGCGSDGCEYTGGAIVGGRRGIPRYTKTGKRSSNGKYAYNPKTGKYVNYERYSARLAREAGETRKKKKRTKKSSGSRSKWNKLVRKYIKQGYLLGEAAKKAKKEYNK